MAVRSDPASAEKDSTRFCAFVRRYQASRFWGVMNVFNLNMIINLQTDLSRIDLLQILNFSFWGAFFISFFNLYKFGVFAIYAAFAAACEFQFREDLHAQLLDCSVTAWISIINDNREINLRILGNRPTFVSTSPLTAVPHWTQRWELCLTYALAPAKPCKFHCSCKQLWIP